MVACSASLSNEQRNTPPPTTVISTAIPSASETAYQAVTRDTSPTSVPLTSATSEPDYNAGDIVYYWPVTLPYNLVADPDLSKSTATSFFLDTDMQFGRRIAIAGGTAVNPDQALVDMFTKIPPQPVTVTVRNQTGMLQKTDLGAYIRWSEDGIPYSVLGMSLTDEEVLTVVNNLEPLTRADWEQQFTIITSPTPTVSSAESLYYLWPATLPEGWVIHPDQSHADATAFKLYLTNPANPQAIVVIEGGVDSQAAQGPRSPGEPVTIRGQAGVLLRTGGGRGYYWRENGIPYSLTDYVGLDNLLDWVATLESTDLATWQQRLAEME